MSATASSYKDVLAFKMKMGRIVPLIQREEKEKKKIEVRLLQSHGYCVVDLTLGSMHCLKYCLCSLLPLSLFLL